MFYAAMFSVRVQVGASRAISNKNKFVIQKLHINEDVRAFPMLTYIMCVYVYRTVTIFSPLSKIDDFVTQERRFIYITHTDVHYMSVYVIVQ